MGTPLPLINAVILKIIKASELPCEVKEWPCERNCDPVSQLALSSDSYTLGSHASNREFKSRLNLKKKKNLPPPPPHPTPPTSL